MLQARQGSCTLHRPLSPLCCAQALLVRINALREAGRAVILLGDLNISLATIDSCDPGNVEEFNSRSDRRMLTTLLTSNGGPFLDTFRKFHLDRWDAYSASIPDVTG